MKYELIVQKSNELASVFASEKPWITEFLGHSEYQIRNFVIKQGNPTEDTQSRQCARELWARRGALRQAKHMGQTTQAKVEKMEAEIRMLSLIPRVGAVGKWRDALIASRAAEIEAARGLLEDLSFDITNRIAREVDILLRVSRELKPVEGDRYQIERDNWNKRAMLTDNKQLLEMCKEER